LIYKAEKIKKIEAKMKLGEIPSKEEMKICEALTPEILFGYSED
jgi:hypothetical protein